ncbi:hypothetical protein PC41400_09060 [Paenibacillus chitinolyticus]|uniref:DUF1871 domain-containing protein n=1 Tax=Paenibacillus chitinolyticus TaxID=79263 RepID=A0A410WTW7_9BACL|nr:hypothetical protein [Paenibacillus chitinolyticus]MCY9591362.1 hypothetical protein [Paenibacillus chitinolyticus]MCY9597423.1 hypothetical protein [Paenibacillus chitinolyticus]QAV17802.1 hypothetical protein PC41400_09060 [Paenibacillus chitinolyticus]
MTANFYKIQEIINEWNPIEIEPLLDDEYSFEVEYIVEFISEQKTGLTLLALRETINEVFNQEFERFYTQSEQTLDIAKKIMHVCL